MKKALLFLAVLFFISLDMAEAKKLRLIGYQGEIRAGYSVGVGANPTINKWGFHTIHGVRISQYFSVGVGLGYDLYRDHGQNDSSIPIFLNVKGYLPVSKLVRLFLSFDYGRTFAIGEIGLSAGWIPGPPPFLTDNDIERFYTIEVGASIKISRKKAMNFSVGYDLHRRNHSYNNEYVRQNNSMIVFRVGFQF